MPHPTRRCWILGVAVLTASVRTARSQGAPPPSDSARKAVRLPGLVVTAAPAVPLSQVATRENVRQLPALAEPDIARVLPFLAGVTQATDLRATVHLAGSADDELSYTLDGFTLGSAVHLFGIFSGVNATA